MLGHGAMVSDIILPLMMEVTFQHNGLITLSLSRYISSSSAAVFPGCAKVCMAKSAVWLVRLKSLVWSAWQSLQSVIVTLPVPTEFFLSELYWAGGVSQSAEGRRAGLQDMGGGRGVVGLCHRGTGQCVGVLLGDGAGGGSVLSTVWRWWLEQLCVALKNVVLFVFWPDVPGAGIKLCWSCFSGIVLASLSLSLSLSVCLSVCLSLSLFLSLLLFGPLPPPLFLFCFWFLCY